MKKVDLIDIERKKTFNELDRRRILNNNRIVPKLPPLNVTNTNYFPNSIAAKKPIFSLNESKQTMEKSVLRRRTLTFNRNLTPVEKLNTNVYYWYFNETQPQPQPKVNLPKLKINFGSRTRFTDDDRSTLDTNRTSLNSSQLSERKSLVKKQKNGNKLSTDDEDFYDDERKSQKSIDYFLSKKRFLSSAELRNISMSEKFIKEAKKMIYAPKTNCFYPKKIATYLIKNKIC